MPNWDDVKDKTPSDIIWEIDYAVKHCYVPPQMIAESYISHILYESCMSK